MKRKRPQENCPFPFRKLIWGYAPRKTASQKIPENINALEYTQIWKIPFILTVYSCHVTYTFQSESTLYSCLNVKELLAQSRREIWSLSDCNWTRTQIHLVRKKTHNHLAKLAKWFSVRLQTKWFWVRVQLQPPFILL